MKTVKQLLEHKHFSNSYMGKDPWTSEPLEYEGHMHLQDLGPKETEISYHLHNTRDPVSQTDDISTLRRTGRGSGLGSSFVNDIDRWTPEAIKYAHNEGRTLHVLPTDHLRDRAYHKILIKHGFKRTLGDMFDRRHLGRYWYDPKDHPERN